MNIAIFSYADDRGGAAKAAYRLYKGTSAIYPNQRMIVFDKGSGDQNIEKASGKITNVASRFAYGVDRIPLRRYPRYDPSNTWSTNWFPYSTLKDANEADIIHLHWIGAGVVPIKYMATIQRPIVWTMHDEWAYTGGCHYTSGCKGFEIRCGVCPQLGSTRENDLSRSIWTRKKKAWQNVRMTLVAPSKWLAERAARSSLLDGYNIRVIPNGLDLKVFRPIEKKIARSLLQIPDDKTIILFGAVSSTSDPRKGYPLLRDALQKLPRHAPGVNAQLLVFGASHSDDADKLGFPVTFAGIIHDDLILALLYSAADVFVAPSLQDNLPNTVMESLACGTPVVGFNLGGIPDMIDHKVNGYLASEGDSEDLANGIAWVVADRDRWHRLSMRAREKCEQEFELSHIARRYADLYEELLIPQNTTAI